MNINLVLIRMALPSQLLHSKNINSSTHRHFNHLKILTSINTNLNSRESRSMKMKRGKTRMCLTVKKTQKLEVSISEIKMNTWNLTIHHKSRLSMIAGEKTRMRSSSAARSSETMDSLRSTSTSWGTQLSRRRLSLS